MADLVITPANVLPQSNTTTKSGTAGASINAGQMIYLDTADSNKAKLADANVLLTAVVAGMALCDAEPGQPIQWASAGDVAVGTMLTPGIVYLLSGTAGGLKPDADMTGSDYVSLFAIAKSTSVLTLAIRNMGILHD